MQKSNISFEYMPINGETDEFDKFTNLLDRLLAVPHPDLKAALDAEKEQKKAAKSDLSSGHVSREKG